MPTQGDTRCIVFGHLTRMAVWKLRQSWDETQPTAQKIAVFAAAVSTFGHPDHILKLVAAIQPKAISPGPLFPVTRPDEDARDAVSF